MISSFLLTGCFGQNTNDSVIDQTRQDRAIISCKNQCDSSKIFEDFSNGPCLSNSIQPDWVCDIVHSPREAVDDDPANQCSAYSDRTANHYVELDTDCNLIKAK